MTRQIWINTLSRTCWLTFLAPIFRERRHLLATLASTPSPIKIKVFSQEACTFPAPREVAGPLLWEKGSCQMGPQRRVWKITREIFLLKSLKFRREDHW